MKLNSIKLRTQKKNHNTRTVCYTCMVIFILKNWPNTILWNVIWHLPLGFIFGVATPLDQIFCTLKKSWDTVLLRTWQIVKWNKSQDQRLNILLGKGHGYSGQILGSYVISHWTWMVAFVFIRLVCYNAQRDVNKWPGILRVLLAVLSFLSLNLTSAANRRKRAAKWRANRLDFNKLICLLTSFPSRFEIEPLNLINTLSLLRPVVLV